MTAKGTTQQQLNLLRKQAVELRLKKVSLSRIHELTGLSTPTIISAHQSFLKSGWKGVKTEKRGRPEGSLQLEINPQEAIQLLLQDAPASNSVPQPLWTIASTKELFEEHYCCSYSEKSITRLLHQWEFLPGQSATSSNSKAWLEQRFPKILVLQEKAKPRMLIGGIHTIKSNPQDRPPGNDQPRYLVYARDLRKKIYWFASDTLSLQDLIVEFLDRLTRQFPDKTQLFLKSYPLAKYPQITNWLNNQPTFLLHTFMDESKHGEDPTIATPKQSNRSQQHATGDQSYVRNTMALTHLERLEAESIQIMREVIAHADNPVMLYSIGKDSAVMLHLAMKAFFPAKPPFPLLHVDTGWKFREMYSFRDQLVKELGMELISHMNPEGIEKKINPFTHGSALHTDIMKTEGLKQALDQYGFDVAFGGARRDEEKSRAKERVFSFRTSDHRWDPKNQRPELWKHYNARKQKGESIRVFPISNWTELDIWQYIHLEQIPIVPLYYAAERPVVERDGALIMVDDERMPLNEGEIPVMKSVRFRTLGCYPLTGAVESEANTLPSIIQEMLLTKTSERQGRVIDHDSAASMEKKKQEGYF